MKTAYDNLPDFNKIFIPDFEKGTLTWAPGTHLAGKVAGYNRDRRGSKGRREKKYCMIQYKDFANWSRAKVLYYMKWGIWVPMIDHINGDSLDDRISNLREVSASKNAYNIVYHKKDKKLPVGVYIDRSTRGSKIYCCQFRLYKKLHKRRFYTAREAHNFYLQIMRKYYGKDDSIDYYIGLVQGSDQWKQLRKNRWTGTKAIKLLQGKPMPLEYEWGGNWATKRGQALEPIAVMEYERVVGKKVIRNIGAIINNKFPIALYSPDGLVALDDKHVADTLLEVKCLNGERHEKLATGDIPLEYLVQIYFGMVITGLRKARLLAFNPEYEQQLTVIDIPYDKAIGANIRKKLRADMKKRQAIS